MRAGPCHDPVHRQSQRLKKPLKREGERGEDKWEEISWDEAFDLIESRMKTIKEESGPEAMTFVMGTGRDIAPGSVCSPMPTAPPM